MEDGAIERDVTATCAGPLPVNRVRTALSSYFAASTTRPQRGSPGVSPLVSTITLTARCYAAGPTKSRKLICQLRYRHDQLE